MEKKISNIKLCSYKSTPEHLIDTIKEKIKKLNNAHYNHFNRNNLFVFVGTSGLYPSYIKCIIEAIDDFEKEISFDIIYLYGHYEFVVCNMNEKNYNVIDITKEQREMIKHYAEEEHKNNNS